MDRNWSTPRCFGPFAPPLRKEADSKQQKREQQLFLVTNIKVNWLGSTEMIALLVKLVGRFTFEND